MRAAIISTGAAFALGAALSWSYQGNRYDARISNMERDNAVILAEAHRRAKQDYETLETRKNDAINLAYEEMQKHKANSDAARADVGRLQRKLADVPRRIEQASRAAVDSYAQKATELLGICSSEYQKMGERADEHYINERLMIQAWPSLE